MREDRGHVAQSEVAGGVFLEVLLDPSASSGSPVAATSTQESCLFYSIPLDSFKIMNIDDKHESIFAY